ncbi:MULTISPECIES: hypothetical protein [Alicyclobacillus]|uniref:Uncharacterized protein n=1 Tax=Alicyclobacillus acidoterrestris (strain ATCC 49025 / DSM 3922 / CIP 106132 / NCIMB 13137 / GD3B) TaxID=1356854 RepID=T0B9V0_ALIAG|nr:MULTISPECIES: hypothetical protein [Alicyclobacillus]EPZ40823.1 hypothetical protein N007_17805 [Alicyclobacillus acidoterrestris ATCC 49025]UNO51014.1 hypothetical protein K1I37_21330 [Alicyclobacillus acidoterrestris]GEO28062.1 hypothetical protein AAC03nite_38470 [Alicyclobacillus acidoterrestris]
MKLSEVQDRYEAILHDIPSGKAQDKALSNLMDVVKREFGVPLMQDLEWEREHPAVIAMYRKIANSRTFDY